MRSSVFLSLMTLTEVVCNARWSVVIPKRVSAVLGSCALIPCTFEEPIYDATLKGWWKKGGPDPCKSGESVIYSSRDPHGQRYNYADRAEFSGDLEKSQCSLLINNIRKSDEGIYCFFLIIVWHNGGYHTGRSQVLLSVSDKPEISGYGELTSGKTARLTCSITHSCPYDKLQLRWNDNNGSLPLPWDAKDGAEIFNEPSGSWIVSSVLTFTPSSAHDGKKLGCTIILNGFPSSSPQTLNLEIKYGLENPTVNSSIVAVEGSSLLLYCTAWGKPAVRLRWVKNGEDIIKSSTSELTQTFQNIKSEDDGEYWCVAKNSRGTANSSTRISVEYKPTIVSGPICTNSEDWTDCNCSVRANPPANITWGLNGRIITGNRSDVKVFSWAVNIYLVQSSLTLTHPTGTGTRIEISCVAANVHGDCVSKYQLHSEGIFSWINIFILGGGAAGLVILIAVVITVRRQRKKLGEAAYVSETDGDSVIYAVVQKARNAENVVRITTPGLGITKSTKPDQNEGILSASINISNFRKQERSIQNEDICEYAKIKHYNRITIIRIEATRSLSVCKRVKLTSKMHEPVTGQVYAIYYPILAAVGVPVNIVAIVILSRGKCGLSKCITHYLVGMAAADLLVVVTGVILNRMIDIYFPGNFLLLTPICRTKTALVYATRDFSVWSTVAFTFDRFTAICCPKLKTKYCTKETAAAVVGTVIALSCLKNIPWYFVYEPLYTINKLPWYCRIRSSFYTSRLWLAFSYFDCIATPFLPFFVILLLNALTVRYILVASRVRRALRGNTSTEENPDPEMENRKKSIILLFSISEPCQSSSVTPKIDCSCQHPMKCFAFFFLVALRFIEAALIGQWSVQVPKQLSVLVGSCVVIPCTTGHSLVGMNWMWLKGGFNPNEPGVTTLFNSRRRESVDPAYRHRSGLMIQNSMGCSFWIHPVSNEDRGEYYVTATFDGKRHRSDPVFLSVFEKPSISVSEEITAGQAASVTCSLVHSCPDARIDLKWIMVSELTAANLTTERKDIDRGFDNPVWKGSQKVSSVLIFTALRQHDRKMIGCEIQLGGHPHGVQEMITLDVQYPPTEPVANSTSVILLGRPAFILCSTQSNPESSLGWIKDGAIVSDTSSNNILKTEFSNITFENEGQYFCNATNKHGFAVSSINITVEYPPSKPMVNCSLTVREGGSVFIYCITRSKPESHLQWMKDGEPINSSYSNNVLTKNFPDIKYEDDGEYQCEASNKHGTAKSWMYITVEYAPRKPVVNSSIVALEGSSLYIYCKAEGNPPVSVRWMRNGEVISTPSTSELKEIFHNISLKDDGQYWCVAENNLGTANSYTQISVEYPPRIVEPPNCARTQNGMNCVCTVKANPPMQHVTWRLDGSNVTGNSTGVGVISSALDSNLMLSTLTLSKELELDHNVSCIGTNKHGVTFSKYQLYLTGRSFWKLNLGIGAAAVIIIILVAIFVTRMFRNRNKRKKVSRRTILDDDDTTDVIARFSRPEKREGCENDPDSDVGELISNSTQQIEEINYHTVHFSTNPQGHGYVHDKETSLYEDIKHS
ncbi:uncharacterized protein [Heptranchias perlo]|uniref:uncharacterized protein n=1 Tax=Heptranchias perlo TaxID=212740 RepID=UPI00355AAD46